jgi:hypothetical protein
VAKLIHSAITSLDGYRLFSRPRGCADDSGGPAQSDGMTQGTDHSVEAEP